ncbi:MAG: nucleoside-diphosphate-sugar epimerase [Candidatus Latescibacterota bacterium]|jgi:nucleoside-diphosphate-sugar epimerase
MAKKRVVVIGAAGFLAGRVLPAFREQYDLVLLDVYNTNRAGEEVEDVVIADVIDTHRDAYRECFRGADVVVHCGAARSPRSETQSTAKQEVPLGKSDIRFQGRPMSRGDDAGFESQMKNIQMMYNIYQTCVEENVKRVVALSSNHAADFYEHLIWGKKMGFVTPEMKPYSDNYYGWAKGAYESLGFTFAAGAVNGLDSVEVVQLRIGGPREDDAASFSADRPEEMHRGLGCYLSARDQVQLMTKSIDTEDIRDDNGVPFQIFYGISDNTHKFWDLSNARRVIGYEPMDDSAVKFGDQVGAVLKEAWEKYDG